VHLTLVISTTNNGIAFNLNPSLAANNPPSAEKAIEGPKDETTKDDATASGAQKQVSSPKASVRMLLEAVTQYQVTDVAELSIGRTTTPNPPFLRL
jgi:hypothetical protein